MYFKHPGVQLCHNDEHFWRAKQILHTDVPEKMRGLFKSAFKAKYRCAWEDNAESGEFFIREIPDTKKTDQLITSTVRQGTTAEFDGATLYYCLLDCGTDLLESKARTNVEKLRAQSKALHDATSTNLSEEDFHERLQEIQDVYRTLQWDHTRLDAVTQSHISPEDYDGLTKEKNWKIVRGMSCFLFLVSYNERNVIP